MALKISLYTIGPLLPVKNSALATDVSRVSLQYGMHLRSQQSTSCLLPPALAKRQTSARTYNQQTTPILAMYLPLTSQYDNNYDKSVKLLSRLSDTTRDCMPQHIQHQDSLY